jgi:hypothetical protein
MRKDPIHNTATTTYAEIAGSSVAAALAHEKERPIPNREAIAKLAYRLWEDRGRPHGSSEYDWLLAEELLRTGAAATASPASS